ncbi:MAG: hypothetical protein K2P67_11290 [Gallionellaceae bacterium]|nr:hypothetical protein [Gallionellaceae bacterium]
MKDFFGVNYNSKHELRKRLNLLGMAEAHIVWKTRLWHHIQGNVCEPLDASLLGQAGVCQLANLINGKELEHLHSAPEFEQLSDAHRQFHHFGALIIEHLKEGNPDSASAIFECEYSASLRNIIQSLIWLNRHFQKD